MRVRIRYKERLANDAGSELQNWDKSGQIKTINISSREAGVVPGGGGGVKCRSDAFAFPKKLYHLIEVHKV